MPLRGTHFTIPAPGHRPSPEPPATSLRRAKTTGIVRRPGQTTEAETDSICFPVSPSRVFRVASTWLKDSPERRIIVVATGVLSLDQITKGIVAHTLEYGDQRDVLPGFFRWVHWGNTGAAWSQFAGNNSALAVVACAALLAFWRWRHQFEAHRHGGQIALGCLFGGIIGNLIDRLWRRHVVDFLYFYCRTRSEREIGFPAFNVADMGITTSVILLLFLAWRTPPTPPTPGSASSPLAPQNTTTPSAPRA